LQTFWKVTIPHLRSIIGTVLMLEVIWNFQHFETIYVMTNGGPAKATTTFSIAVYETAFQAFDLGRAGAIGILWMVLLAGLVFIYLRFSVQDD
jgi:multiple sugar transport system permease protein